MAGRPARASDADEALIETTRRTLSSRYFRKSARFALGLAHVLTGRWRSDSAARNLFSFDDSEVASVGCALMERQRGRCTAPTGSVPERVRGVSYTTTQCDRDATRFTEEIDERPSKCPRKVSVRCPVSAARTHRMAMPHGPRARNLQRGQALAARSPLWRHRWHNRCRPSSV